MTYIWHLIIKIRKIVLLKGISIPYLPIKFTLFLLPAVLLFPQLTAFGADDVAFKNRESRFHEIEAQTGIPWAYIAGIDQYERNLRFSRKDLPPVKDAGISIYFTDTVWCGIGNPNLNDEDSRTIQFFGGLGKDGDGDGKASRNSDQDLLYTMVHLIDKYGFDKEHFKISLWNYYHRDAAISIIMNNAALFQKYGTIDLQKKVFPLPKYANYSYKDTWGMSRGWGGRRTHEGTDIFAGYGVQVRSTCYGTVELKGWNKFGGWRVGIRDINNSYHYYAHLSSFAKDLAVGQLVEPGQVIGGVGSSGYGPKGTSGKFPPHLHYGLYKENGRFEWAFNPYPFLKKWEKEREPVAR
jgi:murein DD-endopeptidase MepM/ murein hydrolase activator NlpD